MGKAKKLENPVQAAKSGGVQISFPDGFGRAAEKLVDTIRHVVDLSFSPNRIKKKIIAEAEGEAAAMVIRAEANASVLDIKTRAAARVQKLEVRRQENIESIVRKAVDELPPPDQVSDQPVEPDWVSRFFRECQDISDEQMQLIWARILAGEVARPGRFSPRTLSVVRDLTKYDADLFAKVCSLAWFVGGMMVPVINDVGAQVVADADVSFGSLTHLTSIGLVEFNSVGSFTTKEPVTEFFASYFGMVHHLKSDGGAKRVISLGHVIFTAVGTELYWISNAVGGEQQRTAALNAWIAEGWREETAAAPVPHPGASPPSQDASPTPTPAPG